MKYRRLGTRVGGLLLLVASWAAGPDATLATEGPAAGDGAGATRSCYSLYAEVSELLPKAREREVGFFDIRENQIAASAWLFYPIPASLYLGYQAVTRQQARLDTAGVKGRIRELRNQLADQLCFVR